MEIYQMPQSNDNVNSYNQFLSQLNLQVMRQRYDAYNQQHQHQDHHHHHHQQQQQQQQHQPILQQPHLDYIQQNGGNHNIHQQIPVNHHPSDTFKQRNSEISNLNNEDLPLDAASPSSPSPSMRILPGKISKRPKSRDSKDKSKRIRTIFTPEQLRLLEEEFARQMYLVGKDRDDLSNFLGLSQAQVKVWFQNRRIKYRKTMGSS